MHVPIHPDTRTIHRLMYARQPLQCAEQVPYTHEKTRSIMVYFTRIPTK